ncbi:MAG: hypothetical protein WC383_02330 [Gammaproteobacteria bacterium]
MERFVSAFALTCLMIAAAPSVAEPPSKALLERALNDYRRGYNAGLSPIQVIGLHYEYDGAYRVFIDHDPTERNPVVFENGSIRLLRLESNAWLLIGLGIGGSDTLLIRDPNR